MELINNAAIEPNTSFLASILSLPHCPRSAIRSGVYRPVQGQQKHVLVFNAPPRGGDAVSAANLIQRRGPSLTGTILLSACEHGRNAARRGKHLQACPFDAATMEWRQWREGFLEGALPR